MNDQLATMLREAAAHETLPPAPAAQVRRHAERVRTRRRAVAAVAGVAAAAAVAVAAQGPLSGVSWTRNTTPAGQNRPTTEPTSGPTGPGPTSSAQTSPTTSPSAEVSDDSNGRTVNTATPWPAPPTSRIRDPWTRPGFDSGSIVAARMEDGHAVITVDRTQMYSRQQWKEKTGETSEMDFMVLNESTRTRQFVVEDDALVYAWYQLGAGLQQLTPREFVDRVNEKLLELANQDAKYPQEPGEPKQVYSVSVIMFHRDNANGPVAFIEDSSPYTS